MKYKKYGSSSANSFQMKMSQVRRINRNNKLCHEGQYKFTTSLSLAYHVARLNGENMKIEN